MVIAELLVLAVGLSMDAFAVSICKGLSVTKTNFKQVTKCGLWFGGFQALMPLIGFYLGSLFADYIKAVDHWIAFLLLALIGASMLKDAFGEECECCNEKNADFSMKTMFTMAVATSIDALMVGVSLAMAGDVNIWMAVAFIGVVTCLLSGFGVKVGGIFGSRFGAKAQIIGGILLILLGLKILLEHLGVL